MARLNQGAILKEFRTRAALKSGLSINYDADLKVPYAVRPTKETAEIFLPMPDPTWDEAKWIDWEWSAEHELGHVMPGCRDAYDVLNEKNIDTSSFLGSMFNIVEDHRQEHHDFNKYAGRAKRLSRGRKLFWDNFDVSSFNTMADPHRQAMETQFVWDNMIREEWMHGLSGSSGKLIQCMSDQQLQWLDKLQKGDYESTLKSGITAEEEYDLVKRIVEEVYGFNAEQEEQAAQRPNKCAEKGDGKGESGTEQPDGGGDSGDSSGDGSEAEGSTQAASAEGKDRGDSGKEGQRTKDGKVNYSDLMAHNHNGDETSGTSYASLDIVYDGGTYNAYHPVDPGKFDLRDLTDGSIAINPNGVIRPLLNSDHGRGLAKHVRRLLQVRSQSRYQHNMKRGKVSPRSIYRGALQGPASERVFKKRYDSDVLDTAVTVLCDASGSMGARKAGGKIVNAGISMRLLNEAIAAIGVPVELIMFDDNRQRPRHAVLKTFTKRVDSDILMDRFATACNFMSGSNSDGESILFAYDRLLRQKNKRKVLIVLSDGQPACGRGDVAVYTKKIVKEIEKSGIVDIYAIGINSDNVTGIYKNHAVIFKPEELEAALLSVIERKILN